MNEQVSEAHICCMKTFPVSITLESLDLRL